MCHKKWDEKVEKEVEKEGRRKEEEKGSLDREECNNSEGEKEERKTRDRES